MPAAINIFNNRKKIDAKVMGVERASEADETGSDSCKFYYYEGVFLLAI